MNIVIRKVKQKDRKRILELSREMFWNLYFLEIDIPVIIDKLHRSKDFIKDF